MRRAIEILKIVLVVAGLLLAAWVNKLTAEM